MAGCFLAAGLIPFLPNRVLLKLNIYLRTPTPPLSRGSDSSRNFTPKTPFNSKDLRRQALSIKALLRTQSRSLISPSKRALNQLIKGCELAMHSAILLAKENKDLRDENENKKQKRARSRRQIPAEEGLSVQEASEIIARLVEALEIPLHPPGGSTQSGLEPRPRAAPRCSGCGKTGHKINRCPDK
ncbi:Probable transposable element [Penicillium roqueforti FM164]|uniref:Probable transposable element n=1 Tax=Penicillium roqueforti (strain FM164) TaxID=1365484 RepID=W6QN94_PENRF|nr:Probable transposable element [Penicillium roqueforti FM164]